MADSAFWQIEIRWWWRAIDDWRHCHYIDESLQSKFKWKTSSMSIPPTAIQQWPKWQCYMRRFWRADILAMMIVDLYRHVQATRSNNTRHIANSIERKPSVYLSRLKLIWLYRTAYDEMILRNDMWPGHTVTNSHNYSGFIEINAVIYSTK